ncbi:MAG: addiction module protein [Planctomycetes bacterium]|nr:addiction module protein [Planctomycetota bacterium]
MAHGLLLSLEQESADADVQDAWAREIEARLAAVDRGEFAPGDWRDVIARVRESVLGAHRP